MPTYQYKAKNQAGQEITGEIEAADSKKALAVVMDQGLFPLSLREKKVRKPIPEPRGSGRTPGKRVEMAELPWTGRFFGVSLKEIILFTRQFAALQDAGLPILRSLEILHRQLPPGRFRRVTADLAREVGQGHTLTEAMVKHPQDFDKVYVKMVEAGETGGFLEKILNRLADAKEKALDLRRKVIRAAMYPALVCCAVVGVLILLVAVVIPIIVEAVGNVGGPLGQLLAISHWFTHGMPPGWLILLGIPFGIALLRNIIKRTFAGRYVLDMIKLNLPVFGRFYYKTAMIRFSRVLGSLIEAGVPIIQAMESTRDTTGNEVFALATDRLRKDITGGTPLTQAVMTDGLFDPVATNMIEVGEETGDLDKVLLKLADNYQEELDAHIGYMMTMLEVGLIILMCAVVGGLVIVLFMSLLGGNLVQGTELP